MFSKFQEDGDDSFQGFLALPLGRDVERAYRDSVATTRAGEQRVAQILLSALDTG